MEEKSSKDKIIATHYAELNRLGANAEYERALKCANKSKTSNMELKNVLIICFSSWFGTSRSFSIPQQNCLHDTIIKIRGSYFSYQ